MTGDFTRFTFDPKKNYSAVRMQQGRLFSDADWNEQADIHTGFLRNGLRQVIGASGFPAQHAGFKLTHIKDTNDMHIGHGVAFVEGVQVQNEFTKVLKLSRVGSGASRRWRNPSPEQLQVGDILSPSLQDFSQLHTVIEVEIDDNGEQRVNVAPTFGNAAIISTFKLSTLTTQANISLDVLPASAESYVFYLDVWERSVGAIEDPAIVETAYGGPDTAARNKIVWQVKYIVKTELESLNVVPNPVTCASFSPGWSLQDKDAAMFARAKATQSIGDVCTLPPSAGYRSLENHLYRVEIHNPGTLVANQAAFKWSRDNANHRTRYELIDSGDLVVNSIGNDDETALKVGDWVEIKDDARILAEQPGFFARISEVNDKRLSLAEILDPHSLAPLTDNGSPDIDKLPSQAHVIRWEGGPPVKLSNDWLALEHGVEVKFVDGAYTTGDFWTIPARSLTGDVEWPKHPSTGDVLPKRPQGTAHGYAALALVKIDGVGGVSVEDCRRLFAPLAEQHQFYYLGGDGQEALPNIQQPNGRVNLASPLRVGVVRGRTPVAGQRVRFSVISGQGLFGNNSDNVIAATNQDGQAQAIWAVDSINIDQQVMAELLDADDVPTHAPIIFSATLSHASETAYDPANTPSLAGADTVQKAIELLVGMQQIGCSTHVITQDMDWVTVLQSLPQGEDASICFAPGNYTSDETIVFESLGHIRISGAGDGTRIIIRGRKCAFDFQKCDSVTVHHINIATPDGSDQVEHISRKCGTITTSTCDFVDIYDCSVSCGAGPSQERTCLTLFGVDEPMRSVQIYRNRFVAGYLQDAMLITDCENTLIEHNQISTEVRPAALALEKFTADVKWRRGMLNILMADPVIDVVDPTRGGKSIRGGRFSAVFESVIPQSEWNGLVKRNPPTTAQISSARTFTEYSEQLVKMVLEKPALLPSFEKTALRFGRREFRVLDANIKRHMLFGSEMKVGDFFRVPNKKKNVIIEINGSRLAMNSPIRQTTWLKAFEVTKRAKLVQDGKTLVAQTEKIATRLLKDKDFRAQFADVDAWLISTVNADDEMGGEGIVCAGKLLNTVKIHHNVIDTFQVGIRVATSLGGGHEFQADVVELIGNRLKLQAYNADAYMPFGLLVGNANTIRIERNDLEFANDKKATLYNQGIRVWGILGDFIAIRENRISIAQIGIKVLHTIPPDDSRWGRMQWIAADNLSDHPKSLKTVESFPRAMVLRNNKPAP